MLWLIFEEVQFCVVGVKGLANFQGTVRNLITKELESLDLAFCVKEIGVVENINEALIVFVTSLNASFSPLCVIVYLTDAVGKTSFNIKADKYAKMLVL